MAIPKPNHSLAILVILLAVSGTSSQRQCNPACKAKEPFSCDSILTFNRTGFPLNFTFGVSTSAYQIEGSAHRALNSWDYFTHRYPEKVRDRSSGDLACDSYHLYTEDVEMLKRLNVQAYRFSIAWSRVLPRYGDGSNPPGRCTSCELGGDSGTEPYVVAHHQLLAHAEAVSLYRKRYQKFQGGKIGTTLIGTWFTPLNETSSLDKAAAKRAFDFTVGWFLDPLVYGDYPKTMKEIIGARLPIFTPRESKLVKGSLDFLGLDYYFTQYATDATTRPENPNVLTDPVVTLSYYNIDLLSFLLPQAASFVYYPPGFRSILNYIKEAYKNPLTYITENGFSDYGNLPIANALADTERIQCHCSHLSCLKCSIEDGCNVAGYFAWSLMDNYEFVEGYTLRFGMNWVNFTNPADRKEKDSGKWFSNSQNVCNPACKAKEPFKCDNSLTFNRTSFPKNFTFGAATSAYQIEGAAHRALNGWDYYTHRYPEKVPDRSSGDLACDSYDLYKEDVKLLKRMKVQAYRLSIAWSRVLPKGRLIGGIDENGIKYYNNLINELKANGIEPYVTIFHWDVPQTLEDKYGGFLSRRIVEDYTNYAELLFQRFGDRVKFWITLNQPYSLASKGYGDGSYPPGRCTGCEFGGNSGTEPYIVAHHQLLAHAKVVSLYRKRYQARGKIGTTLIGRWFTPLNGNSILDKAAAKRAFDFFVGWFLDPLVYGTYPKIMRQMVGNRLPKFTPQESKLVKGSLDFLGLNYYVTQYATDAPPSTQPNVLTDPRVALGCMSKKCCPYNSYIYAPSFVYYPPGFRQILNYIKNKYGNPLTYITENVADLDIGNLTLPDALADNGRIQNHCSHLSCLKCSIDDGCNVAGYFAWSLMDNYEFGNGYTLRFGLNWVNFSNPADRREKAYGKWFSKFIIKQ
ncbi:unnamed protein product [Eruca vesicaria subsp. sativa]|uniref:Sinigrinase n=1 Tax=Eruca vesicaria subsp. sativa TaxID=29727 RepID=A0ABC8J0Z9_ERUVS|nr:unnamed protein product [Eruca vesicaria subsp. sativa]